MTRERLARLMPVARAKYEAEFASVRALLQAESHCRAQLARIEEMSKSVRDQSLEAGPMQLIGADVLFQKSIDKNRSELNRKLAQILAHKETAMIKVRTAFGRKHAIELAEARLAASAAHENEKRQRDRALAPWLNGSKTR
ncbi:unnamed protein product [Ectocarpus sp. 12 AP-2014]